MIHFQSGYSMCSLSMTILKWCEDCSEILLREGGMGGSRKGLIDTGTLRLLRVDFWTDLSRCNWGTGVDTLGD